MAIYFSLATMILVPGVYDLNRAFLIGLCLSVAANCLLLSGMLFVDSRDGSFGSTRKILKTAPVILMFATLAFEFVFALSVHWRK